MAGQPIQVGYGKATFPDNSATFAAFVVEAPFKRTLVSKAFPKVGQTRRMPVSAHPDIDGWLFEDTVPLPDGTIVCIQASRRFKGRSVCDGAIFIRTRLGGASLLISAHIPHDARCTHQTNQHVMFCGYGDILTYEEATEEGIDINSNFRYGFMDEEEVEETFNVQVIAPAKAAKPKVEKVVNVDGEEVKLNVARGNRRMRIRKE